MPSIGGDPESDVPAAPRFEREAPSVDARPMPSIGGGPEAGGPIIPPLTRERLRRAAKPAVYFGGFFAASTLGRVVGAVMHGSPAWWLVALPAGAFAGFGLFAFAVKLLGMDIFSPGE